jgi:hypothetical protein
MVATCRKIGVFGGNPVADKPEEPSLAEWARRMEEIMRQPKPPPETGADKPAPVPNLTSDLSRETIVANTTTTTIRPFSPEAAKPQPTPEKPKSDFWTHADKAVFGLCELLALLFGLPFGDDLYHDMPLSSIGGWHWFYLGIAIVFAVAGPMWPLIRTRTWLPAGAVTSLSKASLDARIWIATLLLLFLYGIAPEIYNRATGVHNIIQPPQKIFGPPTAEQIAKAAEPEIKKQVVAATASIQKQLDQTIAERDAANRKVRQLEALQSAPPAPPIAADGPRVFTDKTKEQIWNTYCEGRTELQCSILMNEEKNKWITLGAIVELIHTGGNMELSGGVICNFDSQWLPALSTLRPGDHMTINGQIVGFNVRFFILQKCEIKSPS